MRKTIVYIIITIFSYASVFAQEKDVITKENANKKLIDCSIQGKLHCVKEALEKGADVNTASKEVLKSPKFYTQDNLLYSKYKTPLIIASYEGHIDIVKFLLEKKADIDRPDMNANTALMG
ncbi:MAG: ankyrin repeat domain-containing protein [Leptospiraceae bacterium]|nr:ankyrin repeat domain-containing protein [Leptospiraceae bacterium]MCP5501326.1 ankyrin repeat domain-containing protein [Leptospiraceae bacterium]